MVRSIIRLYEIQAKLRRADKHLSELKTEIAFVQNLCGDGSVIKNYPDGRYQVADLFDEVLPDIRVMIGEFTNALRSSLNYFVIQLSEADSGLPADSRVQFPIDDTPEFFQRHRTTFLKGVSHEHIALFERLQPYNGCDWIRTLKVLSNIDKHTGLVSAFPCARSMANNAQASPITVRRKVKMNLQFVFEIALGDGTPVIETLEVLQLRVTEVLDQFDALIK